MRIAGFPAIGSFTFAIDHFVPFQRSPRGSTKPGRDVLPTAKQCFGLEHDTAASPALDASAGAGLAWTFHFVPFQYSTSGLRPLWGPTPPTAKQLVRVGHDTPLRTAEVAGGVFMIDQRVPFQCSARVLDELLFSNPPTAKQLLALGHATPARAVFVEPEGRGEVTVDQTVPFHCSINARLEPSAPCVKPTATQRCAFARTRRR